MLAGSIHFMPRRSVSSKRFQNVFAEAADIVEVVDIVRLQVQVL
jgi:hypothetical protein